MSEIDVTLRGKSFPICATEHWGRVVLDECHWLHQWFRMEMVHSYVAKHVCPSSLGWLGWPKIAWKCVQSYLHHLFYNRTIYIHLYSFETCSVESIKRKMWVRLGEYPSSLFPTIPPYVLHNAYVAGAFPKLHTCSIRMFPQPQVKIFEKFSSLKKQLNVIPYCIG